MCGGVKNIASQIPPQVIQVGPVEADAKVQGPPQKTGSEASRAPVLPLDKTLHISAVSFYPKRQVLETFSAKPPTNGFIKSMT